MRGTLLAPRPEPGHFLPALAGGLDAHAEGRLREPAEERGQEGQSERQREENHDGPHRASAVRLDRDGAEELPVLRRELRGDGAAPRAAREENARVGATPENLLDGVARGFGR